MSECGISTISTFMLLCRVWNINIKISLHIKVLFAFCGTVGGFRGSQESLLPQLPKHFLIISAVFEALWLWFDLPPMVPDWQRPEAVTTHLFPEGKVFTFRLFSFFGPLSGRQLERVVELELVLRFLLQRDPAADAGVQRALLRRSRVPGTLGGDPRLLPAPVPRWVTMPSSFSWPTFLCNPSKMFILLAPVLAHLDHSNRPCLLVFGFFFLFLSRLRLKVFDTIFHVQM